MKLTDQVTSRELSERLAKLGVKQESHFYWIYTDGILPDGTRDQIVAGSTLGDSHWELGGEQDTYAAFTTAELGMRLPIGFSTRKTDVGWLCEGSNTAWMNLRISFEEGILKSVRGYEFLSENEAKSRGLMLEFLIINKLITP